VVAQLRRNHPREQRGELLVCSRIRYAGPIDHVAPLLQRPIHPLLVIDDCRDPFATRKQGIDVVFQPEQFSDDRIEFSARVE
jgi:hypothetical protein